MIQDPDRPPHRHRVAAAVAGLALLAVGIIVVLGGGPGLLTAALVLAGLLVLSWAVV